MIDNTITMTEVKESKYINIDEINVVNGEVIRLTNDRNNDKFSRRKS